MLARRRLEIRVPVTGCRAIRILSAIVWIAFLMPGSSQVAVWTYHNDPGRTGANTDETILTPANVTNTLFGKKFSQPVDGSIYAQPLYVPNVSVAGKGTHNVIFVATEHDSLYAFDADNNTGSNALPLWQVSYINSGAGITPLNTNDVLIDDIKPDIGITGTPVIDLAAGTLYLVAKTKQVSGGTTNFFQTIHAVDIASGADRTNAIVQASISATGAGSVNSNLAFNALREGQRSGLVLANGLVYVCWASHGDNTNYHGWVMGFDPVTLQLKQVFNTSPNGTQSGIWQGGGAPALDAAQNLYFMTGNGTWDGTNSFGDSFVRLSVVGTNLSVSSFFTPFNQATLSINDTDLGSGAAMVLPDSVGSVAHPHLAIGAGKNAMIYLVDRDNMGGFHAGNDSQIVQPITNALVHGYFSTPCYFNGKVYFYSQSDVIKAFSISNAFVNTTPVSKGSQSIGFPSASVSISANGMSNGICWALQTDGYKTGGPAILRAYDANNLTVELYDSTQAAGSRDVPGPAVKFAVPTVANGRVYVGTATNLSVYGGLASIPAITTQPLSQTVPQGSNATFSVMANGPGTLTYQWQFNGVPMAGATISAWTVANAQGTNAGDYNVIVSNTNGSTTSLIAILSVLTRPSNNPGCVPAPTGLVNWWPAEGNANDIFTGNPGLPQSGLTYSLGKVGLAFQFNGVDQYIVTGGASLPLPWTASVWVNRQDAPSTSAAIIADDSYSLKLEQYNGTRKLGFTQLGVGDYIFNYSAPTGTWVNLTLVGVTGHTYLYVNGALQDSLTNTIPLPRKYIAAASTGTRFIDFMAGGLDEILLFNRALSDPEIASIYSVGGTGFCSAPEFRGVSGPTAGQIALNLVGQPGKSFSIYSSSNLSSWYFQTSTNTSDGYLQLSEPFTAPMMFYKASQP